MSRPTQSTKAQTWKQHFADFERSELTVAQFCQSIGCSTPTFYHWKRKLSQAGSQSAFLRVQTFDSTASMIEITLPTGVMLRVPLSAIDSLSTILEQVA
jgi:transposase-like protein